MASKRLIGLWAGYNYYPGQGPKADFIGWYRTMDFAKLDKPAHAEWAEIYLLDVEGEAPELKMVSYWPSYTGNGYENRWSYGHS